MGEAEGLIYPKLYRDTNTTTVLPPALSPSCTRVVSCFCCCCYDYYDYFNSVGNI